MPPPGSGSVRTHQMPQPLLNPHRLVQPPGGGGTRPDMRQLPRPSRVAVTAVQNKQTRVSTKIVLKIVLNIVYRQRVALGKDTRGYPLKLALNSLYGKLAQRSGSGPYHDAAAAGLVTAMTRARLIEAIAYDPEAVVIAATDGVFSLRPLPLDIGDGLGQCGQSKPEDWPDLFIARSGVYWSPSHRKKSVKSRGASRSVIGDAAPRFERAFAQWLAELRRPGGIEAMLQDRGSILAVLVKLHLFHGCKLAIARNKPWLAGLMDGRAAPDELRVESQARHAEGPSR